MSARGDNKVAAPSKVESIVLLVDQFEDILGSTLTAIGGEKAAIIKPGSLAVTGASGRGLRPILDRCAVIDAPLGRGHMVLFAIRPMWRYQSQGTFAMVLNAMANWNHLDTRAATSGRIAAGTPSSTRTSEQ